MTLNKVLVPVVLGLGIDTKKDPKQMTGSLLKLENAIMTRTGEFKKRNGFTSLGTTVLGSLNKLSSGIKLLNYNEELTLINDKSLYSYGPSSKVWSNKGPAPTTSVTTSNIVTNSFEQTNQDMCYSNGTSTYAWEDSRGGVRALVVDQNSGARQATDILLHATGIRPRCFAVGQFHFVFYVDTVTENLVCRRLDTLQPGSFGNENIIAANIKISTPHFDVCLLGTTRIVVAFRNESDQLQLAIVLLTGLVGTLANGVPSPLAITAQDPTTSIAITTGLRADNKETFHITWYNTSTGLSTMAFYEDFTVYKAAAVLDASVSALVRNITSVVYDADGVLRFEVFYERNAAAMINRSVSRTRLNITSNTPGTPVVFQRSAGLASKAYRDAGSTKVQVCYASLEGFQDTFFSLSDTAGLQLAGWGINYGFDWGGSGLATNMAIIAAKILPSVSGGHTKKTSQLPGVWSIGATSYIMSSLKKIRLVADNTTTFTLTGIASTILDHSSATIGGAAQLGQNLHIPGGFLKMYDGESVTEHGFHLFPESITSEQASSGSLANGTYQHTVVWEWIDAKGQIHRSAPSVPVTVVVTGGPKRVTLTIPTLRYTAKRAPARTEVIASVYRTTANGTVFYKVSSDITPTYNDTQVDTISYVDTLVDADITSRPLLYTTGGVLDHIPPTSCQNVVPFKNRLFVAGNEQESTLWYSKESVTSEGVAFSEALTLTADSGSGGITALGVLDDKLIVFKRSQIFILTGEGPTDAGTQNDFKPPQQIATDVGCVEPESVVITPKGLMFKSEKGIYLLDRSLQTIYIGDRVQEFNALDISAAVLIPDVNQVRYTTTAGITLVYDYYLDAWSTYTKQNAVSAISWQGIMVYLNSNGQAKSETAGSYADDGVPIKTVLETSWMSLSQLMGYQRLYRIQLLGSYVGEHNLRATIYQDFKDGYSEQFQIQPSLRVVGAVYGVNTPYGVGSYGGSDGVYTFEIKPSIQKCTSFKIRLEDLFPTSNANGSFSLSGMTLIVGSKTGTNKLPTNRTLT